MVKNQPAMQETPVQFLGRKEPLQKEITMHSSILPWRIPWTEEPGGLQSMESQSWTRLSDKHYSILRPEIGMVSQLLLDPPYLLRVLLTLPTPQYIVPVEKVSKNLLRIFCFLPESYLIYSTSLKKNLRYNIKKYRVQQDFVHWEKSGANQSKHE